MMKVSKIDLLTILIALAALLTSICSIYFQFFNKSTELAAKYTGVSLTSSTGVDGIEPVLKFMFLNKGDHQVALISGFSFLSFDESEPEYYFTAKRSKLAQKQIAWYTEKVEEAFIIEPGEILSFEQRMKLEMDDVVEYFGQNVSLQTIGQVEMYCGISLNFMNADGELQMVKMKPAKLQFSYEMIEGQFVITGNAASINSEESDQILDTYQIF